MSNNFTAQELADFYQKVADGGEAEFFDTLNKQWFVCSSGGPIQFSIRQNWRIKPAKKVIDLSVLIDSQIDCEFRDDIGERTTIGKLLGITNADLDLYPYTTGNSADKHYGQCQPRIHHIHAWQGGECPLPEGFVVKVWFRSGGDTTVTIPSGLYWGANSETMAFEVIGIADGYVMPWEQAND